MNSRINPSLAGADIKGEAYKKGYFDKDGLPYIGRKIAYDEPYYR